MKNEASALPPPVLLAITYAPVQVRARLAWLLTLDQRLADVLTRASEPMIAQLRLSWWRDALKTSPDKRPKGEPLLADLNEIEPDETLIVASLAIVDAYEILATDADMMAQVTAQKQRISAICCAYSFWIEDEALDSSSADQVADYWRNPAGPIPKSIPRILRPLSILALAEKLERFPKGASPLRLNWHALTGR